MKKTHCTAETHDFFFWYIPFIQDMELHLHQILGIWNCDSRVLRCQDMFSTFVKSVEDMQETSKVEIQTEIIVKVEISTEV